MGVFSEACVLLARALLKEKGDIGRRERTCRNKWKDGRGGFPNLYIRLFLQLAS